MQLAKTRARITGTLLAAAARAGADEIEHAKLCFGRARAFDGLELGPNALPIARVAPPPATLGALAAETLRDGCADEIAAALLAAEGRERTDDARSREVLAILADDEERHAELAFRIVAFALERGGSDAERAVQGELGKLASEGSSLPIDAALARHGLTDRAGFEAARTRAVREITVPCAS